VFTLLTSRRLSLPRGERDLLTACPLTTAIDVEQYLLAAGVIDEDLGRLRARPLV
jgi:hypothetical protein